MVKLEIAEIIFTEEDIKKGVEHIATDWEVYDDNPDENKDLVPILTSYTNARNLLNINFEVDLDINKTYYGRARVLLSSGYSWWGNAKILLYDRDDSLVNDKFPTRLSTPLIRTYRMKDISGVNGENLNKLITTKTKTNSDKDKNNDKPVDLISYAELYSNNDSSSALLELIDPNYHDLSLFYIKATGYNCIGNAAHIATTWWIEDIHGNVVYYLKKSTMFRDYLLFDSMLLKSNKLYVIKAMFHSDTNDVSQIGKYEIVTSNGVSLSLDKNLTQVIPSSIYNFNIITTDTDIAGYRVEIYSYVDNNLELIFNLNSTNSLITIPANTFKLNTNYLFRARIIDKDEPWIYYKFSTTSSDGSAIDDEIKSVNISPNSISGVPDDTIALTILKYGYEDTDIEYIVEQGTKTDGTKYDIAEFNLDTNILRLLSSGSTRLICRERESGKVITDVKILVNDVTVAKYLTIDNVGDIVVNENNAINIFTNFDRLVLSSLDSSKTKYSYKISNNILNIVFKEVGVYDLVLTGYATDLDYYSISIPVSIKVIDGTVVDYAIDIDNNIAVKIGDTESLVFYTNYSKIEPVSRNGFSSIILTEDTITKEALLNITVNSYVYDEANNKCLDDIIDVKCYDVDGNLVETRSITVNISGLTTEKTKLSIGKTEYYLKWYGKLLVQLDTDIPDNSYDVSGYPNNLVLDKHIGYFTLSVPDGDKSMIGNSIILKVSGTRNSSTNVIYTKSDEVSVVVNYSELDILESDIANYTEVNEYINTGLTYGPDGKAVYEYPSDFSHTVSIPNGVNVNDINIVTVDDNGNNIPTTISTTPDKVGYSHTEYTISFTDNSASNYTTSIDIRYDKYDYDTKTIEMNKVVPEAELKVTRDMTDTSMDETYVSLTVENDINNPVKLYWYGNYDNVEVRYEGEVSCFVPSVIDNEITLSHGDTFSDGSSDNNGKIILTYTLGSDSFTKEITVSNRSITKNVDIVFNTSRNYYCWWETANVNASLTNIDDLNKITLDTEFTIIDGAGNGYATVTKDTTNINTSNISLNVTPINPEVAGDAITIYLAPTGITNPVDNSIVYNGIDKKYNTTINYVGEEAISLIKNYSNLNSILNYYTTITSTDVNGTTLHNIKYEPYTLEFSVAEINDVSKLSIKRMIKNNLELNDVEKAKYTISLVTDSEASETYNVGYDTTTNTNTEISVKYYTYRIVLPTEDTNKLNKYIIDLEVTTDNWVYPFSYTIKPVGGVDDRFETYIDNTSVSNYKYVKEVTTSTTATDTTINVVIPNVKVVVDNATVESTKDDFIVWHDNDDIKVVDYNKTTLDLTLSVPNTAGIYVGKLYITLPVTDDTDPDNIVTNRYYTDIKGIEITVK